MQGICIKAANLHRKWQNVFLHRWNGRIGVYVPVQKHFCPFENRLHPQINKWFYDATKTNAKRFSTPFWTCLTGTSPAGRLVVLPPEIAYQS